jgi:hypothetical protein
MVALFTIRTVRLDHEKIMPLDDILAADAIFPALKAGNKKQALQELAAKPRFPPAARSVRFSRS